MADLVATIQALVRAAERDYDTAVGSIQRAADGGYLRGLRECLELVQEAEEP
jgi:hypothetical protein